MTRLRLDALRALEPLAALGRTPRPHFSFGGDFMLGFYFHVPFCHGKCPYCDFYSLPDSQENMDGYVQAVLTSLAPWRDRPGALRPPQAFAHTAG